MLAELGNRLDGSRTHFVGRLSYGDYKRILHVSAAHIHLTYPFVLSWSFLEAMASGCVVIGSDTAPVREALCDRVEGRLVRFFDLRQIASVTLEAIAEPSRAAEFRVNAIDAVREKFSRTLGLRNIEAVLRSEAVCLN